MFYWLTSFLPINLLSTICMKSPTFLQPNMNFNRGDKSMNSYDVAVVGYGPVGKLLALLLAKNGWQVGIFEKHQKQYPLPRAIVFDDESARILQGICDMDKILEISEPVLDPYVWKNAERKVLLSIDVAKKGRSGWHSYNFSQPALERLLDIECQINEKIDVYMGQEVIDLKEEESYVVLKTKKKLGEFEEFTARYVVGCDGANSTVRRIMDVPIFDMGFKFDWLVCDIIPKIERDWGEANWQLCDPKRPTTIVSGGPGRRRWEFMKLPNETIEDLNKEETAWRLLEPWGVTPQNAELERHVVYTFRANWVKKWKKGRMLLAGDAAHLMPPFMGQGLNSGLRDAKNLAWKLDGVLRGHFKDSFLDTYMKERQPHVQAIIEAALYLGKMICVTNEKEAEKRDQMFLTGKVPLFPPFPILTAGVLHYTENGSLAKLSGELSVQGKVLYMGKEGLFDDTVGSGWMVISKSNPHEFLNEKHLELFKKIGAKILYFSEEAATNQSFVDIEGVYNSFFNEHNIEAVIVRPDFYIFGAAPTLNQLSVVADDLYNQLTSHYSLQSQS
jgi:2-polyprenyl-6-methoxyphenol hydroxylase-like FAD-dependent oxidoreductase